MEGLEYVMLQVENKCTLKKKKEMYFDISSVFIHSFNKDLLSIQRLR